MDVDIKDESDSYEVFVLQDGITEVVVGLCLDPVGGLLKEEMSCEHHDEINDAEDDEHA